ncbi:hypothetical protein OAO01_05595 [Oligoflexia bacterium]|nr:hypothetical protein [Oligoflexia bacterium]
MFFRKKKQYPLPKFPDTVIPTFRNMCEALPVEKLDELKAELDVCVDRLEDAARNNSNLNISLARQIAQRCDYLIQQYPGYARKKQELVIGAVHYFAIADDPFPEEEFATGFDDDARVMNHVLEALGIDNWYLDTP